MNAPLRIARHAEGPLRLRLMGGAALVHGANRTTEDADLLQDEHEIQRMIDESNLGHALEATNAELEPEGLYLTHIFGPEQEILTPEWRENCRVIIHSPKLEVSVLGPLDLILSKMCRGDDGDLADIAHVIRVSELSRADLVGAMERALVPHEFLEIFVRSRRRIMQLPELGES